MNVSNTSALTQLLALVKAQRAEAQAEADIRSATAINPPPPAVAAASPSPPPPASNDASAQFSSDALSSLLATQTGGAAGSASAASAPSSPDSNADQLSVAALAANIQGALSAAAPPQGPPPSGGAGGSGGGGSISSVSVSSLTTSSLSLSSLATTAASQLVSVLGANGALGLARIESALSGSTPFSGARSPPNLFSSFGVSELANGNQTAPNQLGPPPTSPTGTGSGFANPNSTVGANASTSSASPSSLNALVAQNQLKALLQTLAPQFATNQYASTQALLYPEYIGERAAATI